MFPVSAVTLVFLLSDCSISSVLSDYSVPGVLSDRSPQVSSVSPVTVSLVFPVSSVIAVSLVTVVSLLIYIVSLVNRKNITRTLTPLQWIPFYVYLYPNLRQ